MSHRSETADRGLAPARRHRRRAGGWLLGALALVAFLGTPTPALAHAQLLDTTPQPGSTVRAQPRQVVFSFGERVGGTFGAIRVYDAQGREVDDRRVSHPGGDPRALGVGLQGKLPDGTYTATYRVISADTHIVYGGLVFNLGHPGAKPRYTVAGLISRNRSGRLTAIAFGFVRGLSYLTLALMLGGLAFVLLAWLPGVRVVAGGEDRWDAAAEALAGRITTLLSVAIGAGALVSALGVLLQGASASGLSLWGSLKRSVIEATLETRFGEVWGLRAIDWALLGAVLAIGTHGRGQALRRLFEGRSASQTRGARPMLALLTLGSLCLALTPALAGHADVESPVGLLLPADALHVLAAGVWVGGIACLLLALPVATRQLHGAERASLLLAVLVRFSPLALGAVLAIAVTGVLQAYVEVRTLNALHTTYGALVLLKTVLLAGLIALGWVNRGQVIPGLQRIVEEGRAPGGIGALARRTMRGELALMLCVFGATAALIAYSPPIDARSGPFSIDTTIGPAELEMTVAPAQVGSNVIHLYLIDARTGAQFTATKELTVTAKLPSKEIGPLALKANAAGPGHYVLDSAVLSPGGTWQLEVTDRVSEFEQHTRTIEVPIR